MIVYVHPEGGAGLRGEFLPFGSSGPDDPPGDGTGGAPGSGGNGTGRGGNGKVAANRQAFSINTNTQACAVAATARRGSVGHQRQATPVARTPYRQLCGCRGPRRAARPAYPDGIPGTCPRSTARDP